MGKQVRLRYIGLEQLVQIPDQTGSNQFGAQVAITGGDDVRQIAADHQQIQLGAGILSGHIEAALNARSLRNSGKNRFFQIPLAGQCSVIHEPFQRDCSFCYRECGQEQCDKRKEQQPGCNLLHGILLHNFIHIAYGCFLTTLYNHYGPKTISDDWLPMIGSLDDAAHLILSKRLLGCVSKMRQVQFRADFLAVQG